MYESLCEEICSNCVNGNDMCEPHIDGDCPFWSYFESIEQMCDEVNDFAERLCRKVADDYKTEISKGSLYIL